MSNCPLIIAVDLDGTVFGPDHKTIPPRTWQCLKDFSDQGTLLIPVTGRSKAMIPLDSFPSFRYLISSNGGCITDLQKGRVLRTSTIPRPLVKTAWDQVKDRVGKHRIVMELYVDGQILVEQKVFEDFSTYADSLPPFHRSYIYGGRAKYVSSFDAYLEEDGHNVLKINFPGQSIRHCPQLREELDATGLFEVTSDGLNLELNRKGCHKGEALGWLSNALGISPERIVAFGNGNNDRSMLTFAGCGVAMGNAHPSVMAAANYVTASNTDDGIAAFLEANFPCHSA